MEAGIKALTSLLEVCLSNNSTTLLGLRSADNGNWTICFVRQVCGEKKKRHTEFTVTVVKEMVVT